MNSKNQTIYGQDHLLNASDVDPIVLMLALASANPPAPPTLHGSLSQAESGVAPPITAGNRSASREFPRGPTLGELLKRSEWQRFILTQNHDHLVQTRAALASCRDFKLNDGWPTKTLRNERMRVLGCIQIKPPQRVLADILGAGHSEKDIQVLAQNIVRTCSPLTSDVMDLLVFLLLEPKNAMGGVVSVDEILAARNLQKHQGGENERGNAYRGGYSKKQRQDIAQQIELLSWVHVSYTKIKDSKGNALQAPKRESVTPLFELPHMSIERKRSKDSHHSHWLVVPSETLHEILVGGFLSYLPLQIMRYNPVKRAAEKAIARYLFARWRRLHKKGVKDRRAYNSDGIVIKDLLDVAGISIHRHHPGRAEERLSEALIQLMDDGLIKEGACRPSTGSEAAKTVRGWADKWQQDRIDIHPTDEFLDLLARKYSARVYGKKRRSF